MTSKKKTEIDYLIKFGGSLTENGTMEQITTIGETISELAKHGKKIVIIPGGGGFVENIREAQKYFCFNDELAHWMAIHAMVQQAFLLSHYIPNSKIINADNKGHFDITIGKGEIAILDVSNFMKFKSELEHNWENTSDAITVEIAHNLKLMKCVFLKDIDGVFLSNELKTKLTIEQLIQMESTPFDKITPLLLQRYKIEAIIINGFFPERIKALMLNNNKQQLYTKIIV